MKLRDATAAEIFEEPTSVLEALICGDMDASWTTRALARRELERRNSNGAERAYTALDQEMLRLRASFTEPAA